MGITDKLTALLPGRSERHEAPEQSNALALHDAFDLWLQRFFDEPDGLLGPAALPGTPHVEVREAGDELLVRADVPGLDEDDVSLTISRDGLTIRGEASEEKKDQDQAEWRYGSFVVTVPLPPGLDLDHAEAKMKNGVLTVRIPKAERSGERRIALNT
jgi:HSP20 family protein